MTNHAVLYAQSISNLTALKKGVFRLADLCDNPPSRLGRSFYDDVVRRQRFPNITYIGRDSRSALYLKL